MELPPAAGILLVAGSSPSKVPPLNFFSLHKIFTLTLNMMAKSIKIAANIKVNIFSKTSK
jgi:hypothetical protein